MLLSSTSLADEQKPSARPVYHRRSTCRCCGGDTLRPFLSLGPMPLANAFLRSPDAFASEQRFPLDVSFCERCSLVQVVDIIAPEVLFRDYLYQTGFSATIAAHNAQIARTLVDQLRLGRRDLVIEVASNDGSLLKCFREQGVPSLGIEPATNLAQKAQAEGLQTLNDFFDSTVARGVRQAYGPAKVVIGNNVLAHVDEPLDFLRGFRELLHHDGIGIVEVPYLGDLVERLEYDTIYHEHLSYFSVTALTHLCDAAGLVIVRIEHLPVHGGSLRIWMAPAEHSGGHAHQVQQLIAQEAASELTKLTRLEAFADRVYASRDRLRTVLGEIRRSGRTVAGYGAAAKGNTLLNFCGIDGRTLPYIVDKSPLKVGRYTPGTHIPVLPVATLLERQPHVLLILPWNFAEEITSQQHEYRRRGGVFLLPVPEPRFIPPCTL